MLGLVNAAHSAHVLVVVASVFVLIGDFERSRRLHVVSLPARRPADDGETAVDVDRGADAGGRRVTECAVLVEERLCSLPLAWEKELGEMPCLHLGVRVQTYVDFLLPCIT